ncbi:MAG: shikimate kinase [Acidimicrobiales bacterium]|nr:shikimate kinase [Acidimicrobiales bacterium]MCB1016715.1 shikimate kinase [Acidimicrobiales bacterium]MCB9371301.1 shikimate kinase [Microthrixaceae bacterium]
MGDHIVLIGMMGAGKTSVGRRVAEALDRPLVDTDALVEARTGRTVREIFEADGEAAYRAIEADAVADAVDWPEPAVLAAAGGVVLYPASRDRLHDAGTVVWLAATPATLAGRVRPGDHRPLLGTDPEPVLRRLLEERHALYEELADEVVVVDDLTTEQAAECVLAACDRPEPSAPRRSS